MTELSKIILDKWQVRKTRQQKTAFIDFMKSQIPELTVEEGGFGKNRNLVVGDVKSAKVILTAHYDTCALLPFPNFMTPKNIWVYLGYSLLICLPFLILTGILAGVMCFLTDNRLVVFLCSYVPTMGLHLDKIHTKDDCVFDQRNIDFLTEGTLRFLDATL